MSSADIAKPRKRRLLLFRLVNDLICMCLEIRLNLRQIIEHCNLFIYYFLENLKTASSHLAMCVTTTSV